MPILLNFFGIGFEEFLIVIFFNKNAMAKTSIYLNFPRNTEEAFNFYRSVFGGEFIGGIRLMSDVPTQEDCPPLVKEDKNLVIHVVLPILGSPVGKEAG